MEDFEDWGYYLLKRVRDPQQLVLLLLQLELSCSYCVRALIRRRLVVACQLWHCCHLCCCSHDSMTSLPVVSDVQRETSANWGSPKAKAFQCSLSLYVCVCGCVCPRAEIALPFVSVYLFTCSHVRVFIMYLHIHTHV